MLRHVTDSCAYAVARGMCLQLYLILIFFVTAKKQQKNNTVMKVGGLPFLYLNTDTQTQKSSANVTLT